MASAIPSQPNTSAEPATGLKQASTSTPEMAARSRPQQSAEKRERSTRRSDRFKELFDRTYDRPDAELVLDLGSIRKKLNFRTNSLDDGERPAKRQKRDTVRCYCLLTIWDNRAGFEGLPLTSKSSICHVTAVDNGVHGYFVDLELDNPFVIKAAEIRVPVQSKEASALGIIDKYFLEMKIIPCRQDSRWPPMPILGKSDGDHFARDIRKVGSEELQGAIVARYTHLPTVPQADVPLSVFFLQEGRTFRTKYGLQLTAAWQKAGTGTQTAKQGSRGLDIDSFLPQQVDEAQLPQIAKEETKPRSLTPIRRTPEPDKQDHPEVCYSFSGAISAQPQAAQEFRNGTVQGYRCPLCLAWKSHKLQTLEFHLTTEHSKYSFSVQKPRHDPITNKLTQVQIRVDQAQVNIKKEEDEKEIDWKAPAWPFDLPAYVEGDQTWSCEKPPAKRLTSTRPATGFPLVKDVANFRPPNRKRLKAIRLETKNPHEDPEPVYTSISHRPVSPSEDARSETDDEIDNSWQIAIHIERLDLIAEKQNWSQYKRELTKRWDRHRMEEQLENSMYLSNSLIRFVRKQRDWLKNTEDDELLQCFFEFLARLKERRVIDDNIVADVNELIFQDAPPQHSPVKLQGRLERVASPARGGTRNSSRRGTPVRNPNAKGLAPVEGSEQAHGESEAQPQHSSALACSICSSPITHIHKNAAVCMDPECETPSTRYHKTCALSQLSSRKGKQKAINLLGPPTAASRVGDQREEEMMLLKIWSCKDCVARQKRRLNDKEDEKRKEREMVGREAERILGSMV